MTMHVRFMFALDAIGRNKRSFFVELLLMFSCLFMLTISIFINVQSDYCRNTLNQVLTFDIENVGILYVDQYETEQALLFYQEALASQTIHSIGSMGIGATDIFPELADIQQEKVGIYNENMTEIHYLKAGLLSLCNIELEEGNLITDSQQYGKNWHGLYLGSEYKDIPVGHIFTYQLSTGEQMTFEVLGIMKQGCCWVGEEVLTGYNTGSTKLYHSMDYAVIMLDNDVSMDNTWLFDVSDARLFTEAKAELNRLAEKYGLDIQIGSLAANLEHGEKAAENFRSLLLRLFYLLSVTSVICILSFQMLMIWKNSPEYGILYSVGAHINDIIWIILFETVVKVILGFLLAAVLSWTFIQYYFSNSGDTIEIMHDLLVQYVYVKVFLVDCIIMALGVAIPILQLNKMNPTDLIFSKPTNVD